MTENSSYMLPKKKHMGSSLKSRGRFVNADTGCGGHILRWPSVQGPLSTGGTILILTSWTQADGFFPKNVWFYKTPVDQTGERVPAGLKEANSHVVNCLWRGPHGGELSSLSKKSGLSPPTARKWILPVTQMGLEAESHPQWSLHNSGWWTPWWQPRELRTWAGAPVKMCLEAWHLETFEIILF